MDCIISSNLLGGENSNLYKDLLGIVGNKEVAKESFSYFLTQEFVDMFGDYTEGVKNKKVLPNFVGRVDENGEPKLFFSERTSKYYFIDKMGEPVFYPYRRQGLSNIMKVTQIKEFAKSLAFNYFSANYTFDFDTLTFDVTKDVAISEYIKDRIDIVSDALVNNPEFDFEKIALGRMLEATKPHTKEWIKEVASVFNTFKLDVTLSEGEESEYIVQSEETAREDLIRIESFLKASKDNVSNNIKLLLSLIQKDEKNEFGEYKFVEFGDIYASLNGALANQVEVATEEGTEDLFDLYRDTVQNLATRKPYFNTLYKKYLSEEGGTEVDDLFKNQFVAAFRLDKNNYLGTEFSKIINEDGTITIMHTAKSLSDVSSRKRNLGQQWFFNFSQKNYAIDQVKGIISANVANLQTLNANYNTIETSADLVKYMDNAAEILKKLGVNLGNKQTITIEDETFTAYKGLALFLDNNQFEGTPVEARKKMLLNLHSAIGRGLTKYQSTRDNFFETESIFKELTKAEAFFIEEGSDASIFTIGKTKWIYSLPSFLSNKINSWKKNPDLLFKHFMSTPYTRGSHYMKFLLGIEDVADVNTLEESDWVNQYKEESLKRLEKVELYNFNSVQNAGESVNAVDNKGLSYIDSFVDYANKVLSGKKKSGKSIHKTALAADKNTEYQLFYGNEVNLNSKISYVKETNTFNISEEVLNVFYDYFKSEYDRMRLEYDTVINGTQEEKIGNYHLGTKNALQSQMFPSLSISFNKDGSVNIPDVEGLDIYDVVTGQAVLENLDSKRVFIKEHIRKTLSDAIFSTQKMMLDNSIIAYNEEGKKVNNAFDTEVYNEYLAEYDANLAPTAIAADIVINSIASQIEYSKMFTGDVAYYKNMTDYKKRVPASYTDGIYMRIAKEEELLFNVSIIESVEVSAPYLDKLKEYLPKEVWKHYADNKINAADAQAWITPARWKFIKKRLGKWDSSYDAIYKKMTEEESPVFDNVELKKLAQPLKGVYFDNISGRPAYLKYSQAVLLPHLIKDTQLESLFDKMTKNEAGETLPYKDQIHELITKDGIKVGYNTPQLAHDKETGDVNPDVQLTKLPLNNRGWKLQQDLSPKGFHDTDVGSQIQKVIFQGLVYNLQKGKDFYLGDETLSADKMIDHIHSVISEMSNKGKEKIIHRLGIDPTTFEIKDEEALYDALIGDLKQRKDTPDNLIKALEAGTSPYGIPGQFQIFQNVFSSIVNSAMVKIKTNGGGFIQMSDFGLSKDEATEGGVRFTPWFDGGKLGTPTLYKDENGNERLKPGGLFISGSLIAKYVPDYKTMSDEKLFGTLNETTGKYEGGVIDHDILANIIGYRIPNQGLASNDAFQVMGILPEDVADTVVAYTGITTKTGSDFDIDKMYLMLPSFKAIYTTETINSGHRFLAENREKYSIDMMRKELLKSGYTYAEDMSTKDIQDLFVEDLLLYGWDAEFNKQLDNKSATRLQYARPKLDKDTKKELPLSQQTEAVLQNKLIEVFKSVLTNKHVIQDVMTPIDIDYMQNDIVNLYPEIKRPDLMDFDAVTDLTLKQEFRLGKAGLGQNVNSLVDSVRGAMADLYLNNYYIGRGNFTDSKTEGISTEFDKEYSAPLSSTDVKEYLASYNSQNPDKRLTLEQVEGLQKIKLSEAMTALVNGFVDIAKDPYIVRGNWVTQTNNVGFMMLRAGVHPFYVNSFLGQPILKEYVKFITNSESNTINDTNALEDKFMLKKMGELFTKNVGQVNPSSKVRSVTINAKEFNSDALISTMITARDIATIGSIDDVNNTTYNNKLALYISDIERRLKKKFKVTDANITPQITEEINNVKQNIVKFYKAVFEADLTEVDINTKSLKEFRDQILVEDDIQFQMAVYKKFKLLQEDAKKLTRSVKGSKVDVDGKGKNITSMIIANNFIRNILDNETKEGELMGFRTKLKRNGKDTFLNTYIKNGLLFNYKIMLNNPKYFLGAQHSVITTFNYISDYIYSEKLQRQGLADKLEKAHYSYILSGFAPLRTTAEEKLTLLRELPAELEKIKEDPAYKNNALVRELYAKEGEKDTFFVAMPNLKKSTTVKNDIADGWRELMNDNPEFADKLVKYSFIISGFNNAINQFHEFIPYEWFNRNRFNSYIKTMADLNKNQEADRNFIDQFFRNNTEDNAIIKTVYDSDLTTLALGDGMRSGYITKKEFGPSESAPYMTKRVKYMEDQKYEHVYKLIGYDNGRGVYVKSSVLGFKDTKGNRVVEYDSSHSFAELVSYKSAFEKNHLLPSTINSKLLKTIYDRKLASMYTEEDTSIASDADTRDIAQHDLNTQVRMQMEVTDAEEVKPPKRPVVEVVERYSNQLVSDNKDKIYIFGDNTDRKGTGGQATIRNNDNAFGIATKIHPTRNANAYMSDDNLDQNKEIIDADISKIVQDGRSVVFPKDGLGTGLALLKTKAPMTYAYLKQRLLEEFGFNNDTGKIPTGTKVITNQLDLFDNDKDPLKDEDENNC